MKEKGVNIKMDILFFEMELLDDLVKRKFGISDNIINIYKIVRFRYIDGELFGLEIVYLLEEMCKGLIKGILDNFLLYRVLNEKYGYKI